ncbi:SGNH/GDSL hydrolase family protein [Paenibacillus qinlingensis]|uniref:Lysophospholipase L1-like esterase n=1 Tax=Paenibacillus qinlingensis TaxID=1837343 RepID=A0ABU1NXY3_9BACL|nr:SGNH/GDSL hydrolase family protein [Paenibacillus qinlingensis]MDR6551852.1 lysophospholipase L1-like esterase [Paenibacillus qinlingensis]
MKPPANANQNLDANLQPDAPRTDEWAWHSPLAAPFRLTSLPWLAQDGLYRRLPLHPSHPIRSEVDRLANFTTGVQVRFRTDSPKLAVRIVLADRATMYQMPATAQCGVDCYIGSAGEQQYVNTTRFELAQAEYESALFESFSTELREITLNLPLYQGVKELWIGTSPTSSVSEFQGFSSDKKVLIYGTSITHGACASRPGMTYPNQLSRMFPLEFISLGFSGNAQGEPELAHIISQIQDPALLVLDYEGNTPSTEHLAQSLPTFIRIYRDVHPDVPILVISKIPYAKEAFDEELRQRQEERKALQRGIVERLNREGDAHIHFCDGSGLLGADYQECTADGIHPSDLGYKHMAEGLQPIFKKLLQYE